MSQRNNTAQAEEFGFKKVGIGEKQRLVKGVFDSVSDRYDLMNDLMSFGIHRLWKRFTVDLAAVREGERVLDLASGTGDIAVRLADAMGESGRLVMSDINAAMLEQGRDRMTDAGVVAGVDYVLADAEALPLADDGFDCVTIAFGLRNVTHIDLALAEMQRVLKAGGRLLILEFSHPRIAGLNRLYDEYSFKWLPRLGKFVAGDEDSYRYLAESIRRHPDQETLKAMLEQAGFEHCQVYDLTGGVVAVHRGYKP